MFRRGRRYASNPKHRIELSFSLQWARSRPTERNEEFDTSFVKRQVYIVTTSPANPDKQKYTLHE